MTRHDETWHPASLADIETLNFRQRISEPTGTLVAMQQLVDLPFEIVRVFTVVSRGDRGDRGHHALNRCNQVLVCLHGAIDVRCDDGSESRTIRLEPSDKGLYLPPAIWRELVFHTEGTVLMALCDRPYEPDDYIDDYEEFARLNRSSGAEPTPRRTTDRR